MNESVLCPYCGAEMRMIPAWQRSMPEMGGYVWSARGKCPSCGSLTPETHGRTAQEANEAAYAAAQRRYPSIKPLTLEEALHRMNEMWYECPCDQLMIAKILLVSNKSVHICSRSNCGISHVLLYDYNKHWRCWERKPTDEERKAAKWDE